MSEEQDDAAKFGPMMSLLASTGAASLAATLLDVFGVGKLSADERRYLRGPLIVDNAGGWSEDLPKWLGEQARSDRFEIVLGSKPGWIVAPAEIVAALHDASMRAPLGDRFYHVYMWGTSHAVSRHKGISREELAVMLAAPGTEPEVVPDKDIIERNGRYYHAYAELAHDIRRKVIKHSRPVGPRPRMGELDEEAAPPPLPIEIPAALATRMVEDLQPGDRVMITATQPELLVEAARERGASVDQVVPWEAFLALPPDASFDSVVSGPPFPADPGLQHARHAFQFLRPGGHAVCLIGKGGTSAAAKALRLSFIGWCGEVGAKSLLLPPALNGGSKGLRLLTARRGSNA